MTTYVDAAGTVRNWIDAQTTMLVGAGNPLQLGASLKLRDGAASYCYAFLQDISGFLWAGQESPSHGARVSCQVFGPTREAASLAAVALAEAMLPLAQGIRFTIGGVTIVAVDNIEGPVWSPDGEIPRYVVDADWLFA